MTSGWKEKSMTRKEITMSKTLGQRLDDFNIEVGTAMTIDWQQVRIQAAIAAMQGMLANPSHHKVQIESGVPFSNFYAINAVMCADALIGELKKGGQDERD